MAGRFPFPMSFEKSLKPIRKKDCEKMVSISSQSFHIHLSASEISEMTISCPPFCHFERRCMSLCVTNVSVLY